MTASFLGSAVFSDCGRYRYVLRRTGLGGSGIYTVIGLNPSTADASTDDPTIRRCIRFARDFGAAELCMLNLYAWRSTDPNGLFEATDPVGPENDGAILRNARDARIVVAAWGRWRSPRVGVVAGMLQRAGVQLHCLRRNKDGSPAHPLYLSASCKPMPWEPRE